MKIAVLSGKGGTGKTLISVNLASAYGKSNYLDCDVEEPNGYLFFKPEDVSVKDVKVKIPEVDQELCIGCRKCVDFCNFNALAHTGKKLLIFDEICHSCGGCTLVCPVKAISERDKNVGRVEVGYSEEVSVITGILNIGEASGVPIIKELLSESEKQNKELTIIDCPPGSACIVMESIKDADYCVLVAEPSVFGAHNLQMVHELVTLFNKPFGVVLNKYMEGFNPSEEFCLKNNINVLERIPFTKELAEINGNGKIAVNEKEEYRELFASLLEKIVKEAGRYETIVDSQR